MAIEDVKTVKIFKRRGGAGTGKPYSNTYHILSPGSVKDQNLNLKIDRIVAAERALASDDVFFMRAVVSTYAKKKDVGGSDKPFIHKINQYGLRNMVDGPSVPVDRFLPPEACLVIEFGGAIGRGGRHLYRHSIGPGDWRNLGTGVEIEAELLQNANAAWAIPFNEINAVPPIVFVTEDEDGQPTDTVLTASCSGYALRQLTQKKSGKKSGNDFDVDEDTDAAAAEEMAQVIEVLQNVEVNRYTEKGAAFFTSPKFIAALGALGASYLAIKNSKDTNDYGPLALGP